MASTPPEGATRPLDTARRATRILVGGAGAYACWTDAEGALSCSGTHRYTPEQLATLAGANRVRASDGALCGIFRNHTLRCLGRPLCSISSDPTDIGLQGSDERRVDDVALGSCFYCIRATDSQAYCVGTNDRGQLGDGSTASYGGRTHVVAQLGAIEQIVASEQFVCARLTTGSARCWGTNSLGELGDGTYVQRRTPTQPVGVSNVIDIALGRHHACALHPDGTVACWGNNDRGQLGDGSNVRRNVARPVPNLTGVLDVEASDDFTCALTHDHTVYCWGANESGEIGSGTRSDDPVRVAME